MQSGWQVRRWSPSAGFFGGAPFKYLGDWTDRIANGEFPISAAAAATRRRAQRRHHDLGMGNRKEVHARSDFFRSAQSDGQRQWPAVRLARICQRHMPILDPKTNKVTFFKMPVEDHEMAESQGFGFSVQPMQPSAYWGDEKIWDTRANNHNAMFDGKGRVWLAATIRGADNPAFCKKGSDHPSAKVFPLDQSRRQVAMLDPKTMKYTLRRTPALPPITCSSAMTATIRCGSAAPDRLSVG